MAQRTIIELTDDLDNGPIAEGKGGTIMFEIDGSEYEIDLRLRHQAALRKLLEPYRLAARVVKKTRGGGARRNRPGRGAMATAATTHTSAALASQLLTSTTVQASAATIRAWARSNGFAVTDKGRISQDVLRAYERAEASRMQSP